ncbi:hypothetical protein BC940DRAFT_305533 [Gongronella butleri]|nr:hypothetical protein BC940DRAFT_305533 [Gongronella butleri]
MDTVSSPPLSLPNPHVAHTSALAGPVKDEPVDAKKAVDPDSGGGGGSSSGETSSQFRATQCANCGTTTTPLWRRAPNGDTICNACGLYLKAKNTLRPVTMKRKKQQESKCSDADGPSAGSCPGGGKCNGTGGSSSCAGCPAFNQHQVNRHALVCANCRTTMTPLWRRDGEGNTICNACGLYYKLHNVHRPVSMKRSIIKRRKRLMVQASGSVSGDDDHTQDDELQQPALSHDPDSSSSASSVSSATQPKPSPTISDLPKKVPRKRVKANPIDRPLPPPAPPVSTSSSSALPPVPAIEDYIIPKRSAFPPPPNASYPTSLASSSAHVARPRPAYAESTLSLPPISSERRSNHMDPFYRDHASNAASHATLSPPAPTVSLPPISFPPLRNDNNTNASTTRHPSSLPIHPPTNASQQPPRSTFLPPPPPPAAHANNPDAYPTHPELEDWDEALRSLCMLRKKVQRDHVGPMAELSKHMWELVSKTQSVIYGTSPASHSHTQQ